MPAPRAPTHGSGGETLNPRVFAVTSLGPPPPPGGLRGRSEEATSLENAFLVASAALALSRRGPPPLPGLLGGSPLRGAGLFLASSWPLPASSWPLLASCWPLLGLFWPLLASSWPLPGLFRTFPGLFRASSGLFRASSGLLADPWAGPRWRPRATKRSLSCY